MSAFHGIVLYTVLTRDIYLRHWRNATVMHIRDAHPVGQTCKHDDHSKHRQYVYLLACVTARDQHLKCSLITVTSEVM